MFGQSLPVIALGLAIGAQTTWAGPIPRSTEESLVTRGHPEGSSCWITGRKGAFHNGYCTIADIDVDVDVEAKIHKRFVPSPYKFAHPYSDRTPCWVEGRRGWVKDRTCGDLINIDASVTVGKRHHSFDDPYFHDGTPCFHNGREGTVHDLLCIDLDVDIGEKYPNSDYYGPWKFSHAYDEGQACWVDQRRGWIKDGGCGNLLELDADILVDKRFYKDDPYYTNGVPCVEGGKEGIITDYLCVSADAEVHKRGGFWGYHHDHDLYNGSPCWENGHQGVVDGLLCVVADVSISKRGLGPADGEDCVRNGRWGKFRDTICVDIDLDVEIASRGLLGGNGNRLGNGGLLDGLGLGSGSRYMPHNGRPHHYDHYDEDELVDIDAIVDLTRRHLNHDSNANVDVDAELEIEAEAEAEARVKAEVEGRVNKRFHRFGEINHNNNNHHHHGQALEVDAQVDVDVRARNGDLLGPIGNSVKNLAKGVDGALINKRLLGNGGLLGSGSGSGNGIGIGKGGGGLLGTGHTGPVDDLVDLDAVLEITGDRHSHGRHNHGLLGSILPGRGGTFIPRGRGRGLLGGLAGDLTGDSKKNSILSLPILDGAGLGLGRGRGGIL